MNIYQKVIEQRKRIYDGVLMFGDEFKQRMAKQSDLERNILNGHGVYDKDILTSPKARIVKFKELSQ